MKKICIFGDSITWGAGLPFRGAWVNLLRNYIEQKTNHYIKLYDLGIDGDTTRDLLNRFDVEAEARKPELIIFAIGINDSLFRDKNIFDISLSEFAENLNKVYSKAKKFTKNIWFMGLVKGSDKDTVPLKRSTTNKCYSKVAVKKYNQVIESFCHKNDLNFFNLINVLNDYDFDDGLHPNLNGHIKIFEAIRTYFHQKRILGK